MGWETDDAEPFAPKRYRYAPEWENDVERHPDKLASVKALHNVQDTHDKRYVRRLIEVTGEGVFIVKCRLNVMSGELEPVACSLFTWDEIRGYGT